jgi:Flp pilus assembly protein TadB
VKQEEWLKGCFALSVGFFLLYIAALNEFGYSITWWVVVVAVVLSPVIPCMVVWIAYISLYSRKYKDE